MCQASTDRVARAHGVALAHMQDSIAKKSRLPQTPC
jgi:hypothetical protein